MRAQRHPSLGGPPSTRRLPELSAQHVDAAAAAFGTEHPLVGVLCAVRTTVDQALAIAATQAAGIGLLLTGHPWGLELLIAGTVLQVALALRLVALIETRHDLCRDLIIEGGSARGLEVLGSEWRRLAAPRHRAMLAESVERLATTASRPRSPIPASRPYFSVRVVRPLESELHDVAALLRRDNVPVVGVAIVERLLRFPGSPLWADNRKALAEELARARYLLLQPADDAPLGPSVR